MVNVAGRSKGCVICRRRKVKCDLSLPQCQRCIDLRLACPGPRVGAFFVHAQAANVSPPPPAAALLRIPPTAALRACRADALDQLFVSHFIDSFGLPGNLATGPTWLESLPSFLGSSSSGNALATASIRSASMLSYGTWACDEAIQADSYRWYASALAQLRRAAAQGKRQSVPVLDTAVCAAVMLIHFETGAGTSRNAWVHHVKGAASLLQAAGSEACRGGFLLSVFSHLRFQVFIASMQENTLHAFVEPPWLEGPFREQGKTLFDELVDALFSVQQCLYFVQQSVNMGEEKGERLLKAIRSLTDAAAHQLSQWNSKYMAFLRPASWPGLVQGYEVILSRDADNVESGAAATSLPGVPEAALISLFHAGRLIVSQLASATDAGSPDTAEEDSKIILQANSVSTQRHRPPGTKLRPFMMLPGLKIASRWSPLPEVRSQAGALLLDKQILTSPMADIALTSEGYFSHIAASLAPRKEKLW